MATRSTTTIHYPDNFDLCLYKHWDGGPETMIEAFIDMLLRYKPRGDRDILSCLYKEFDGSDELQPVPLHLRGNMGEDYMYDIYVTEGMGHKEDITNVRIKIKGMEGELTYNRKAGITSTIIIPTE